MSKRPCRATEAGFTLVELLVALTIFAILAASGVGILRSSIDTQNAVAERLVDVAAASRLHALLGSDLGQAALRPTRGPGGERPAFIGEAAAMQLVRGGWQNLDGASRPSLQRVEWRLDNGSLSRIGHGQLDGGGQPAPAIMARAVEQLGFRYRGAAGDWASQWQATPAEPMPVAVEVSVRLKAQSPLVFVFALPPRGTEPVVQAMSAGVPAA